MIITLKGANFADSNIGTLSTWTISRIIGSGATYSGVTYVDKGAAFNATVTIAEGYELGSAGVTVTMGGVGQAYTINGNVITISIASVTGNVVIKVPTVNISTGEPDNPDNGEEGGGESSNSIYPKVLASSDIAYGYGSNMSKSAEYPYITETSKRAIYSNCDLLVEANKKYTVIWTTNSDEQIDVGVQRWDTVLNETLQSKKTIGMTSANVKKHIYDPGWYIGSKTGGTCSFYGYEVTESVEPIAGFRLTFGKGSNHDIDFIGTEITSVTILEELLPISKFPITLTSSDLENVGLNYVYPYTAESTSPRVSYTKFDILTGISGGTYKIDWTTTGDGQIDMGIQAFDTVFYGCYASSINATTNNKFDPGWQPGGGNGGTATIDLTTNKSGAGLDVCGLRLTFSKGTEHNGSISKEEITSVTITKIS